MLSFLLAILQIDNDFTGVWMAGDKGGFAIGPAIFAAVLAITGYINCFFIAEQAFIIQADLLFMLK